jgi:AbrB family looped-hinge helix DNA binding protein
VSTTQTVRADAKGRLTIPQDLRTGLGIEPGDTFFVEADAEQRVLRFAKAENPFDVLIEHALTEREAGRTRSLREFAAENDIALDGN